jgi:putative ATP-binding cassette transporter
MAALVSAESPANAAQRRPLERIQLCALAHRYYHEQSNEFFELGPIDLVFEPGQLTFLVGGNGSGKTTLAKLLVGLYGPDAGEIRFNGVPVNDQDRDAYRQVFSCVFADFHLFEQLLAADSTQLERATGLIERLHLQHKVRIRDGAFTTQELSQGQRKRLALIVAYLEDRPFYVFDEWAADQDPQFKAVFYEELLPELRAAGKTVLVITHDDRYFDHADRLIRMENGRIEQVIYNAACGSVAQQRAV